MKKLKLLINSDCTDASYNLASEEYLLSKELDEDTDIFMLWRNGPSVIIGKNQNAYSQINIDYVTANKIQVIRRLTGGGAVFHDLGNVNYTHITKAKENAALDFSAFTVPVINALKSLGADAALSGRNDICISEKKISGTAQCVYGGKIMHHGTLLYSADLSKLSGALNADEDKLKDKGIKSVKSRVANIKTLLSLDMDVTEFMAFLADFFKNDKTYSNVTVESISPKNVPEIKKLHDEKYSTWEWNFSKSPEFEYKNKMRFPFGSVELYMKSENGRITDISFYGDFFGALDAKELAAKLIGSELDYESLKAKLSALNLSRYIMNCTADDLIKLFFTGEKK